MKAATDRQRGLWPACVLAAACALLCPLVAGAGSQRWGVPSVIGKSVTISGGAASAHLTVRGHASQSANVIIFEASDGTDYMVIASDGDVVLSSPLGVGGTAPTNGTDGALFTLGAAERVYIDATTTSHTSATAPLDIVTTFSGNTTGYEAISAIMGLSGDPDEAYAVQANVNTSVQDPGSGVTNDFGAYIGWPTLNNDAAETGNWTTFRAASPASAHANTNLWAVGVSTGYDLAARLESGDIHFVDYAALLRAEVTGTNAARAMTVTLDDAADTDGAGADLTFNLSGGNGVGANGGAIFNVGTQGSGASGSFTVQPDDAGGTFTINEDNSPPMQVTGVYQPTKSVWVPGCELGTATGSPDECVVHNGAATGQAGLQLDPNSDEGGCSTVLVPWDMTTAAADQEFKDTYVYYVNDVADNVVRLDLRVGCDAEGQATALGGIQTVEDTVDASAPRINIAPFTTDFPAVAHEVCNVCVTRDANQANDTNTGDITIIGIRLEYLAQTP